MSQAKDVGRLACVRTELRDAACPNECCTIPPAVAEEAEEAVTCCNAHALQAKDLAQLACVCAELQDAASANDLWRALFEAEFGEASLAEATAGARGWKSLFNR